MVSLEQHRPCLIASNHNSQCQDCISLHSYMGHNMKRIHFWWMILCCYNMKCPSKQVALACFLICHIGNCFAVSLKNGNEHLIESVFRKCKWIMMLLKSCFVRLYTFACLMELIQLNFHSCLNTMYSGQCIWRSLSRDICI